MGLLYCFLTVTLSGKPERHRSCDDHLRRRLRQLLRRLAHQDRPAATSPPSPSPQRATTSRKLALCRPSSAGSARCSSPTASWPIRRHRPVRCLLPPAPRRACTCAPWARTPPLPTPLASTSPSYKYLATCIGSMIAGLGGLFYVMDYAWRLVQQRLRRPRLARHRSGHLHHLASQCECSGLHPVWWAVHSVSYPHRLQHGHQRSCTRCSPTSSR